MSVASSPAPAEREASGPRDEAIPAVASVAASPVPGRAFARGATVRGLRRPLWGLLLVAMAYTLHWASPLLLPIVLAAVMAVLLSPAVALLARGGLPAPVGAAVVVAVVLVAVVTLALQLSDPVQRWVNAGPAEFKALDAKLSALKRPVKALKDATDRVSKMTSIGDEPPARPVRVDKPTVFEYVKEMQSAAFTALSTVMLLYFLLASGDLFVRKTVRALPRLRDKIRAVEISREVQQEIAGYFRTLTVINIGLGTVTGAAMCGFSACRRRCSGAWWWLCSTSFPTSARLSDSL